MNNQELAEALRCLSSTQLADQSKRKREFLSACIIYNLYNNALQAQMECQLIDAELAGRWAELIKKIDAV